MILDQLSSFSSSLYESLHPLFPKAFAYLRAFDVQTKDGKYELHGQDLVAIVQRYQTASSADKLWEAHQVYGDIQVVYQGLEYCGHADQSTLMVTAPYNAEKDVEKYGAPTAPSTLLTLGRGNFAIFHPQDGHQPGVQIGAPAEILKVVIKFRLKVWTAEMKWQDPEVRVPLGNPAVLKEGNGTAVIVMKRLCPAGTRLYIEPYSHMANHIMKTTLDLPDDLLIEAKALAARRKITLKAMVEHALAFVLY